MTIIKNKKTTLKLRKEMIEATVSDIITNNGQLFSSKHFKYLKALPLEASKKVNSWSIYVMDKAKDLREEESRLVNYSAEIYKLKVEALKGLNDIVPLDFLPKGF